MKYRITYADGECVVVEDNPRADYEFERKFNLPITDAFRGEQRPRHTYVYFLAWASAHYGGNEARDFEDFLSATRKIDLTPNDDQDDDSEEGGADPTEPGQSPDASSS